MTHPSSNFTQAPQYFMFAEFHNEVFATANFNMAVMRELRLFRRNGCQALVFTIVRDPVEMAVSDFYYWPKDHIHDGFKSVDEFLKGSVRTYIHRHEFFSLDETKGVGKNNIQPISFSCDFNSPNG